MVDTPDGHLTWAAVVVDDMELMAVEIFHLLLFSKVLVVVSWSNH